MMEYLRRMNLAAVDLNLLVALDALLAESSVMRAAGRLGLSQPAMSHSLKRLRATLGDPLLVRAGGAMQLTTRARAMRAPLEQVLERVRTLLVTSEFDPRASTRTFQLMLPDYACELLLPRILERVERQSSGVRIEVRAWQTPGSSSHELARAIDVVVTCVPAGFDGFYRQRLFTDHDACARRTGHPLARRLGQLDTFLRARHVAVVGRGAREDPIDTWLRSDGYERNVAAVVPSYLQALHLVAQSDFIAVIPSRVIESKRRTLGVNAVPVPPPLDIGTFDEFVLHPARAHQDPGSIWLLDIIKDVGKALDRGTARAP
jgi:DNA-binding transcriptional LysR family regulator